MIRCVFLIISIALPSNVSYLEKNYLVDLANQSHLGIFVSDLPQNHDLFQLLTIWRIKYSNIPILGTAIISPFNYDIQFLKKQIKTIYELFNSGIELGFGLGDKNLLKMVIDNRLDNFKEIITQLIDDSDIQLQSNQFSLAGSGKKLIDFAGIKNIGLIYNGIISSNIISTINAKNTRNNISSYIMVDVNDYNSLSQGFVSIVSRIITGLSKTELKRLQIDLNDVEIIKSNLVQKNPPEYRTWLPENVIEKVAIFGSKETVLERIYSFKQLEIKQIILSIAGKAKKVEFIEYLNKEIN